MDQNQRLALYTFKPINTIVKLTIKQEFLDPLEKRFWKILTHVHHFVG